jgi:hypothetical protein
VTDCKAVQLAFYNEDRYSSKSSGLWRELGLQRVTEVTKMAAHLSQLEAEVMGIGLRWKGNDKADYWAKDTIDSTGEEGQRYKIARKMCIPTWEKLPRCSRKASNLNCSSYRRCPETALAR